MYMALLPTQYNRLPLWKAGPQSCCKATGLLNRHGTQWLGNPAVSWLGN